MVIDENSRREKDEELLKKREGYNKLKEKKWKEYVREQERRKKILYGSNYTGQIDKFREKIEIQNQKDNSNEITLSPPRNKPTPRQQILEDDIENDVKKCRTRKKKKNSKKKKSVDVVEDNQGAVPQNLIESAKKDPRVVIPNSKMTKKKKFARKSKIPRFSVNIQPINDS